MFTYTDVYGALPRLRDGAMIDFCLANLGAHDDVGLNPSVGVLHFVLEASIPKWCLTAIPDVKHGAFN